MLIANINVPRQTKFPPESSPKPRLELFSTEPRWLKRSRLRRRTKHAARKLMCSAMCVEVSTFSSISAFNHEFHDIFAKLRSIQKLFAKRLLNRRSHEFHPNLCFAIDFSISSVFSSFIRCPAILSSLSAARARRISSLRISRSFFTLSFAFTFAL